MSQSNNWSKAQRNQYELYLLLHYEQFTQSDQNPKKKRLFKKLSSWIDDKTADNCRDHHKSRLKKVKCIRKLIKDIITSNYSQRGLPLQHFVKEIKYFLQGLYSKSKIDQEQMDNYIHDIDRIAQKLGNIEKGIHLKDVCDEVLDISALTHSH